MRHRWLDGLLLLSIVIGAILVWQSGSERGKLWAEHERLKQITGDLVPADPTKIYVRALPTEEPLEFAWRIYFPPGYRVMVRDKGGSGSAGTNSQAVNRIVRIKLREKDGRIQIYTQFPNSSGLTNLEAGLHDLLKGRFAEIKAEQLGATQLEEIDPSEEFVMLKLKLSDEMQKQAEQKLDEWRRKAYATSIFEIRVGPPNGNF